ncbi:tetratricopeptide repeat protein [Mucilaginibacter antarcticus]|uniref:Tetratricopeptide repeat protein n=1 Tax=Mucilaginibacter antarcticus TaxID=1855725 RepID=A0ABW5XMU1_9SPHI
MKKLYAIFIVLLVATTVYATNSQDVTAKDTNEVNALNKRGYNNRLIDPKETVSYAEKALKLAAELKYDRGLAEAYRVKGIGEYYLNNPDSALNRYFDALAIFEKIKDERGQARVYNNLGNLYQLIEYEKALEYFDKAEKIAEMHNDTTLIASLSLNIGNIYNRKNMFENALTNYNKALKLFTLLKNDVILVQCLEDLGFLYYQLRDFPKAKKLLLEAHEKAKAKDMKSSVAAINLTLTDLYVSEGNFSEAEKYLKEGRTYSYLIDNKKDIYDYKHTAYEMEVKRDNFKLALRYLQEIYREDSVNYRSNVSTRLNFIKLEQEKAVKAISDKKDAEASLIKFWAVTVVAGLLAIVIVLLIGSVKRKATTNVQLQELNSEISRQKDNLDRINHHLEEIIDERTKDLQVKNKKLSEYSSYLSHQIRGPIATLKGLMNLEKEGLVDKQECIKMMDKCVSEIDKKIIQMSDMLHDPGRTSV